MKKTQKLSAAQWTGLSLAILAILAGTLVWLFFFETYHLAAVDRGILYRDGFRSRRELSTAIRKHQIRTIIVLNDLNELKREPFKSEAEFCQQRNIKLVHIPVVVGQRPTTADVQTFLDVVADPKNHPVLVHCAQGVRRTGMMAAAYQMYTLKYDTERAKQAIVLWGRRSETLGDIRGFIDDFDPQNRIVGSAHVVGRSKDPG